MPINHYEGAVKHAETAEQLGQKLKDPEWAADHWQRLVEGDCSFHDHPTTQVSHQVWTSPKSGVDCQRYLGYW